MLIGAPNVMLCPICVVRPPVSRFPSKFSSKNPHWLPPIPTKSDPRRHGAVPGNNSGGGYMPSQGTAGYAQSQSQSSYEKDYRSLVPGSAAAH